MSSGRSRSGGTRSWNWPRRWNRSWRKRPSLDCGFEILVGGRDNADIDFDLAVAAQTVEGLAIQHAQQFHLSLQLQFADFVEEQRALVGQFKQTGLGGIGAAEGAFFVSEEFAFHEVFGQRGAVDIDPGTAAAVGRLVDRAGDQFLARAGLARDQNRFSLARHAVDHGHEPVHHGTGENEMGAIDLAGNHAGRGRSVDHRTGLGGKPVGIRLRHHDSNKPPPAWSPGAWPQNCTGKLGPVLGRANKGQ